VFEAPATRIKICGLTRPEDARLAVTAGADYLGAILSPGFGRSIDASLAAQFAHGGEATLVAVVVNAGVEEAARVARTAGAGVIQLHGSEDPGELNALRDEGDWQLWKSVAVRRGSDLEEALDRWVESADGILLEGFRAGGAAGAGVTFPWEALEALRTDIPEDLTLVVAGGLTPDNVAEAVSRLCPNVVDVSSGVEEQLGVKDQRKVRAFVSAAQSGSAARRGRVAEGARGASASGEHVTDRRGEGRA
jgi:phosphoribosylanthranilate isomerase